MSDNQINLVTNLILAVQAQLTEKERTKLCRAAHVGRAKEYSKEAYQKINNTLNQGIGEHLINTSLDRIEYWAEFIVEMIYFREKNIDIDIKTHYSYWNTWKVQNHNLQLEQ